jgi:hypothetical protein
MIHSLLLGLVIFTLAVTALNWFTVRSRDEDDWLYRSQVFRRVTGLSSIALILLIGSHLCLGVPSDAVVCLCLVSTGLASNVWCRYVIRRRRREHVAAL